ncbi:MAG: two-component system chemotaxis response regulator CheY [Pirellulaceae bacterium]|jgi:two-component system chemotaxis response regulator CheY
MNVLVVDDVELTRMMLVKGLKDIGVKSILEAEDGVDALRIFKQNDIDVIFSDWKMPRMDGIELAKKIRELTDDCPVIMITAESTKGSVIDAIRAGVSDYLIKPFDPVTLREKLTKWTNAVGTN